LFKRSTYSHLVRNSVHLEQSREGHRSLATPERLISEYNDDLIFLVL